MNNENLEQINEDDFPEDSYDAPPNFLDDIPVTKQEQIDNKIMSSFNKHRKIIVPKPIIKYRKVIIPKRKKNGEILLQNGLIVPKRISTVPVLEGFEKDEIDFPITDWFNDSRTSSFILRSEANWIRRADNLAIRLFIKSLSDPRINYNEFLNQLYWDIAAFTDTSKGIEGIGAERAKTQFSKSETVAKAYRPSQIERFERAKGGGIRNAVRRALGKE